MSWRKETSSSLEGGEAFSNPFAFPSAASSSPLFPSKSEPPSFIPIPGSSSMSAIHPKAGPSSEGAMPRLSPDEQQTPIAPSSAPSVPSVMAVTHPSLYIHTHHPRRGSMTPLGLHVISPVPPSPSSLTSPLRSVGFTPQHHGPIDPSYSVGRRGSAASTTSTLTSSRPSQAGPSSVPSHAFYPPNFNRERRRSSLTPSLPTLAPPSPSRTHVTGRINSRPTSSDGSHPPAAHARTRTPENTQPRPLTSIAVSPLAGNYGRRGSLPHLTYGGWNGPTGRTWNPSLPTQRGSVGEGELPAEDGFKFGLGPSAAAAALKNLDLSPGSRRGSYISAGKKKELDVFEEAEAEEAERQRRAFLAATYGQDGKRARERLSFAGPSLPHAGSPGNSNNLRRQSLALWEKINGANAAARAVADLQAEGGPLTAPQANVNPIAPFGDQDVGQRRGSLPLAIPNSGLGRSPSRLRKKDDIDAPPKIAKAEEEEESEEEEDSEDEAELLPSGANDDTLNAPQRPLPPLLPLSDPGPRLLPSTLALHRANHLLTSRNLHAEPLPHPLPPSLHPPAPVDFAEFDIDFILAGSRAQLGGEDGTSNTAIDVLQGTRGEGGVPPTPTIQLGGEDEDTFAKFVGQFDDEYGGRRGEWTFRICPPRPFPTSPTARDPFDTESRIPRAEWDCQGAGRFELFANGDIRSVQTGSVWRIHKSAIREYELGEIKRGKPVIQPTASDQSATISTTIVSGETYVITSKCAHTESGGIKLPGAHRPSVSTVTPVTPQLRVSISDTPGTNERNHRLGSTDSTATAKGPVFAQSLPHGSNVTPKKIRQFSRGERDMSPLDPPPSLVERGRASISAAGRSYAADVRHKEKRSESREPVDRDKEDDKKKGGFGGAIKRAFKNTISANEEKKLLREEREREKLQSQSWSPSVTRSRDLIHPSGKGLAQNRLAEKTQTRTSPGALASHRPESQQSGSSKTSMEVPRQIAPSPQRGSALAPAEQARQSPFASSVFEEGAVVKEGKGWVGVPEESVAMVIPIETTDQTSPSGSIPQPMGPTRLWENARQALLVWYVPFNSDGDERPTTAASSTSSRHSSEPVPSQTVGPAQKTGESPSSSGSLSTSLPKFQKLLRRRASKDKDALKRENGHAPPPAPPTLGLSGVTSQDNKGPCSLHPLPFRSFRVVARMVEIDDLRSESDQPAEPSFAAWKASQFTESRTTSTSSTQSPLKLQRSLPSSSTADEHDSSSFSTAPTSAILQGRTFPTVIAVCHSRSQGVEFVLEGLDRLGFCQGESAWGPTGYEEWRGTGLSEKGRELLDILWAGCVGIMGLTGG